MILKQIAARCKAAKQITLYWGAGRQWVSDGKAFYPLDQLPEQVDGELMLNRFKGLADMMAVTVSYEAMRDRQEAAEDAAPEGPHDDSVESGPGHGLDAGPYNVDQETGEVLA